MRLLLFGNRGIDVRYLWWFLSEREREIRGLSSIFGVARKYGTGWIGEVILIGWKRSATLTVKLNYAPNWNSSFFLLQIQLAFQKFYKKCPSIYLSISFLYKMKTKNNTLHRYFIKKKPNKPTNQLWYCHLLIHAEIYIYTLDTYRRNDNRRRKWQRRSNN